MNNKPTQAKNKFTSFLKTPKGYLLILLAVLTFIASIQSESVIGWIHIAVSIGTAVCTDILFAMGQKRKRIVPDGAVLTGLIVVLVLSSSVPWYFCAFTAAIAILSKQVLKVNKKPIFNPAGFGLAVAIMLFQTGQSWWGGLSELPAWCSVFVLIGGWLITRRVQKFPLVLAFLGTYYGLFLIFACFNVNGVSDVFRMPFSNSVLFLAFFMLTDPPTSPAVEKDQVIFGIIAAMISVVDYLWLNGLSFLLLGLLAANGWNVLRAYFAKKTALKTHISRPR
jgi:Na+-translocating ferredoxin:NAD+ oxidoreductase RnfD subunit